MMKRNIVFSAVISVCMIMCPIINTAAYDDAYPIPEINDLCQREALLAVAESQIGYEEDSEGKTIYSE